MIRVVRQENSEWGEVILTHKNNEYAFPYHIPSREIFNNDSNMLIRYKCMWLVPGTLFITIVKSAYLLAVTFFKAFAETYRYLDNGSFSSSAIYASASDSVRALGYGARLIRWAVQGVITPYQARLQYSQLEGELNRHADGPHRDKFYLAFCFQRIAFMPQDDLDHDQKIEGRLIKELDFIDKARTAIWVGSWQQLMNSLRLKKALAA